MKYRIKMGSTELEEVTTEPKQQTIMDIIKSKLTPIELLVFSHNIKEQMRKELREEVKNKKQK
jgi:hypothetical protein